ncbi:very short patch repair endonuclease [Xanthomonadaceae bacterium JHOS43]|nr:very short patch repair endonuclease [Xanthomonadaceae bacterium JHOS43]
MADVVDQVTRSRMMSGIRGKNTKPELAVRSFLHRAGLRFRLHANLPGKPDLILTRYRTVVFVHGCFWHRHEGCRYATMPASNPLFWQAKFAANMKRDAKVRQQLESMGWNVLTIWSCQLDEVSLQGLVREIRSEG